MDDRFKFRLWDKQENKYHNGMEVFDYMRGVSNPDRYILEQCTGLNDKNGKLIYEGDIVEFDGDFHGDIAWDEDAGCWAIRTTENTIYTFDNLYGYELEIVGNIHENADLLEKSYDTKNI